MKIHVIPKRPIDVERLQRIEEYFNWLYNQLATEIDEEMFRQMTVGLRVRGKLPK